MHSLNQKHHLTAGRVLVALSLLIGAAACTSNVEDGDTPEATAEESPAVITTPCSAVPNQDDGLYCGRSPENGFNRSLANPNWVYDCENHAVASTIHCANGCFVAASGSPDGCN